MLDNTAKTEAGQQYATAHEEHYKKKELLTAMRLYQAIIEEHPETREAGFSRSQLVNVARNVVPKAEMLAAQVGLALAHLAPEA